MTSFLQQFVAQRDTRRDVVLELVVAPLACFLVCRIALITHAFAKLGRIRQLHALGPHLEFEFARRVVKRRPGRLFRRNARLVCRFMPQQTQDEIKALAAHDLALDAAIDENRLGTRHGQKCHFAQLFEFIHRYFFKPTARLGLAAAGRRLFCFLRGG
jgi:hypothetical protein